MTLPEIEAKIAEAEANWKRIANPDVKRAAWEICKDLYAERDDMKRLEKLGKTNLN